ncbi:hypothetical protein K437DRAFT_276429 [Tilletiaria anomala UBC 951]|uniref:Uncharacterized protein n=1 Tax=Tilletiaria anomala (strain ATCC 24038 / CBS 436.72 / UBC 951) TaxID=1037660 RepID=A0A066V8Z2_TILAU|nr:uncharacterized protein K437DRAFT_276429 [Tilletiaria anomala UBC 951]KDN37921.1 hypothetical protein K437DRAFT_276429 [Tilletiaria anomala UBC 951]
MPSRLPEDRDPVPAYAAFLPDNSAAVDGAAGPSPLYNQISYAPADANPHALLPSYGSLFRNGLRLRWHTKPFYLTSLDRADASQPTTALYFRLPSPAQALTPQQLDSTSAATLASACRCSERGDCTCDLGRGSILFTAEYAEHGGTDKVGKNEMIVKRTNDASDVVARVCRGHLMHRYRWNIRDASGKTWATLDRKGTGTVVSVEGIKHTLLWRRQQGIFELVIPQENDFLVAQHHPNGMLLFHNETERMPQDLACDVDGCPFISSSFGFVFRCQTCTAIRYDDTVDYCEAHLGEVSRVHQATHSFVRILPRIGTGDKGESMIDDDVRETKLLRMDDLMLERKKHELIIVSLAVALMDS